jgi:hypothetical protein
MKAGWFKHWNDASTGLSLRNLWDKNDMEAIAFWWKLCELVSLFEDRSDAQNRGKITIAMAVLRRETGWNARRLLSNLSKTMSERLIQFEMVSDESVTISVCNWLKFQETRGQKKAKKNGKNPVDDRYKIEDRRCKIEDPKVTAATTNNSSLPSLLDLWNQNCGDLPKMFGVGKEREGLWAERWASHPDLNYWVTVIRKMANSKFCAGSGTWTANVDWLIKNDTNHQKVIEGRYDDDWGQAPKTIYVWPGESNTTG